LLQAVEPKVQEKADADGIVPGRPVKFNMTLGKPVPK